MRSSLPLVVLALVTAVLAGACGGGDAGLSVAKLREGEDGDCPYTPVLRAALEDAGMPNDIEPLEDNETAYQDERWDDSADSTILGDTDGAHLLCKFELDGERVELDSYYLGDPEGRTAFEDAVAWQQILGSGSALEAREADEERYFEQLRDAEPGDAITLPTTGSETGNVHLAAAIVRGSDGGSAAISLYIVSRDDAVTEDAVTEAAASVAEALGD